MSETRIAFDDANAYERYMGRWSRAIGEKFLAWLDPPANRDWLDLGCGTGKWGLRLLKSGFAVTFVDNSAAMIEKTREKLDAMGSRAKRARWANAWTG